MSSLYQYCEIPAFLDFYLILSMVMGGCCANVWAYEELLNLNPRLGALGSDILPNAVHYTDIVTFLRCPPPFIIFLVAPAVAPQTTSSASDAVVPFVHTTGSLLNNWSFAFNVPLSVMIVFRSGGLAVSMVFGHLFLHKRYSRSQIFSVALVTTGVILATLSRPTTPTTHTSVAAHAPQASATSRQYTFGILMLVTSLFLTAFLGLLQERTYGKYGAVWREGVFYTHLLSLPMFLPLIGDIRQGFRSLSSPKVLPPSQLPRLPTPYLVLLGNLITQYLCVAGVNQLTSRVSSVSTNLALTTRKALSLCFSVWWFGRGWNTELVVGATMVFLGSLIFGVVGEGGQRQPMKNRKEGKKDEKDRSLLGKQEHELDVNVSVNGHELVHGRAREKGD